MVSIVPRYAAIATGLIFPTGFGAMGANLHRVAKRTAATRYEIRRKGGREDEKGRHGSDVKRV